MMFTYMYIRLISRVFDPYCKLRTEFFSIDLWPKREARGPFVGLWKNTANDKEARQDDRVQACLLSYLSKELLIFS